MSRLHQKPAYLFAVALITWMAIHPTIASAAETTNPSTRKSPEWLRSSIVYEIYTRNFSKEGDFNAITARLDELKDLGVDILWLMPIHPIGEKLKKGALGSPYCVRDFYAINPEYGTTNDFKQLVEETHKRQMKLIIDIVAGHTAWDSVLMEHPDYYVKDTNGVIIAPNPEWTDVAKLNYANADLRRYMIDMMKYWMKDFGVDGFRCDVAYTVPVDFWEAARTELEKINPHVIILAEAGAKPGLLSKAFDMDSSWALSTTLDSVMKCIRPVSFLRQSWEHTQEQFPEGALHLRYTDNHHEPRAVVRYSVYGALAAQTLMLTLDGVPLFYNGMEVGDSTESADPALFEKMPVFWHPEGRPPLRAIYRDLINLRKKYAALYKGEVVWVDNTAPEQVISIRRQDAKDQFLVLINLSSRSVTGSVTLPDAEGFEQVSIGGGSSPINAHLPDFNLGSYGWYIFHRTVSK